MENKHMNMKHNYIQYNLKNKFTVILPLQNINGSTSSLHGSYHEQQVNSTTTDDGKVI